MPEPIDHAVAAAAPRPTRRPHAARAAARAGAAALGAIALGAWSGHASAGPRAANGVGALPVAQVLSKSAQALAGVDALVVTGSLRLGPESVAFDVRSTARGRDVSGTITIRAAKKVVGPVRFVALTSSLYLEAAAPFWNQELSSSKTAPTGATASAIVARLAGHWIEITGARAKSFADGFGSLTEPGKFAQSLLSGSGTLVKGTPRSLRGQQVIPITSSKGGTIFVALDGPPLPIEINGSAPLGSSSVSAIAVMSYPSKLAIAAPAGALTLTQVEQSLRG